MKRVLAIIVIITLFVSSTAFGMGKRTQRGVILFFNDDNIVLKTDNTKLSDICDAIENLTQIKIIVDDVLLHRTVSVELNKVMVAELLVAIVEKVTSARYIKIFKTEAEDQLEYFIIFKKSTLSDEVPNKLYSKKAGLQEAFRAKHNALKMSGKFSVSGTFKLNGTPYKFPGEIKLFAHYFLDENKALLNLNDVKLKTIRVGGDYVNYRQYYKGVVIDNLRSYSFQVRYHKKDDGAYMLISNNTIPDVNISVQPKITEKEAVGLVIESIRKSEKNSKLYSRGEVIPEAIELKILPQLATETDNIIDKFKTMALYWSVQIDFYKYYVDAKTGKVYKDMSL